MAAVNKRVLKDIRDGQINLKNEFGILIAPEENNFYKVHFILPGPEDTPFEGGLYHGMIRLNDNHPSSPPNIHMITPSGRFDPEACPVPNGSRGICTTTSSFHPDQWTPMNNIETILKGFISLMCDPNDVGIKGIKSTDEVKKKFAKASLDHVKADSYVKKLFPELHQKLVDGSYVPVKLGQLKPLTKPKAVGKTLNISNDEAVEKTVKKSTNTKKSTDKKTSNKSSKKVKDESSEPDEESSELDEKPKATKKLSGLTKSSKKQSKTDSEESLDEESSELDEKPKATKKLSGLTKSSKKQSKTDSEESLDEKSDETPVKKSAKVVKRKKPAKKSVKKSVKSSK